MEVSDKQTKTLYHSQLAGMGASPVKVLSGPIESKQPGKKGTFYVKLQIQGRERYLHPENPACLEFFKGRAGQEITILATGDHEAGKIEEVGAPPPRPAPAPNHAPAPASGPIQPPPTRVPNDFMRSHAPATPEQAMSRAKHFMGQNATLAKIALRLTCDLNWQFQDEFGAPMPDHLLASVYQSLLFGAERAGVNNGLPAKCDIPMNGRAQ